MKIEQLVVQYLYSNKKVTLQDIGTFTISSDVVIPSENDKDTALPEDSINFVCDKKAQPDEGLIAYIMSHTRKIRPLATSDLESYIMLHTQFLNIGKPLILEGVGTLQKAQTGEYAFTQAGTSHVIYEELPKAITEKQNEKITFATPARERSATAGKGPLWIILGVLVVAIGIAVYYFIHKDSGDKKTNNVAVAIDTPNTHPNMDTASVAAKRLQDSITAINAKPVVADSNSFYIVIKDYPDQGKAQKGYDRLTSYGNKVILTIKDSTYKVRMPFRTLLSDTLRVRDSLDKFFGAKTRIELP